MRKSEIALSGPLVPPSRAPSNDRSGKPPGLGASEPTISNNGLLCQLELGFSGRTGPCLEMGDNEGLTLTGYRRDRKSSLSPEDRDPAVHELLPTGPSAQGFF